MARREGRGYEPAPVLLERIRAERTENGQPPRGPGLRPAGAAPAEQGALFGMNERPQLVPHEGRRRSRTRRQA
jgi:hypothetical protein